MNAKLARVISDMHKNEQKQLELQKRWNEFNKQKIELENLEIIGTIRSAKISTENLKDVIKAYQNHDGMPFSMEKEEQHNEKI